MLTTSVIIPVYNGHNTLQSCLQALQNQNRPPDEIIVVDLDIVGRGVEVYAVFSVVLECVVHKCGVVC